MGPASTSPAALPALWLVRLPGERGPILRCAGELSVATAEALRRELEFLVPLGHDTLTVNLTACRTVDAFGVLTLFQAFERLRRSGRHLAIVAGTAESRHLLDLLGVYRILPVYTTEEAAATAGDEGARVSGESWEEARRNTVARWRAVYAAMESPDPAPALQLLTSMSDFCCLAEAAFAEHGAPGTVRCQYCPLYYELGGCCSEIGCRATLRPIEESLRRGDRETARLRVAKLIQTLEQMPLPEDLLPQGNMRREAVLTVH
jgi:anti-anti-sigma factor